MAGARELQALISSARSTDLFVRHYRRAVERIIGELAAGVSRPGGARAAELVRNLNAIVDTVDPRKASAIRAWIRREIPRAFVLGDRAATRQLREALRAASHEKAGDFGPVSRSFTVVNGTALRAQVAAMRIVTGRAADEMRAAIGSLVRRTQVTLVQSQRIREATVGGIMRGATGRQVADDIASILLKGRVRPDVAKRLREVGFRGDMFNDFERIAQGRMIRVGGATMSVRNYADLVAQTQLREAHRVGTVIRLQQHGVSHVRVSKHVQAEVDECTPYSGGIFFIGEGKDPLGFPSLSDIPNGGPPFHPRSHIPGTVIDECRVSAASKRDFAGEVVTIETARGKKTTITANHPIPTGRGFIPAKGLKVGDRVFSGGDPGTMSLAADQERGPTEVSKLFELCGQAPQFFGVTIPVASEDFYGEGEEGQVAVVRFDREFQRERMAEIRQQPLKFEVVGAPWLSGPGGGGLYARIAGMHGLQAVLGTGWGPGAHHGGEALFGAGLSLLDGTVDDEFLYGGDPFTHLDPAAFELAVDAGPADAELAAYLGGALTGEVHLDRVTHVSRSQYRGHVFCLESKSGLYRADGLIVKNCRHVLQPYVVSLEGQKAVDNARAASALIPKRFFGKTASEVRKLVGDLTPGEVAELFPAGASEIKRPA